MDMNINNEFIPDFMLSKLDNLGYQLKQMYNIAVTFIKIISKGCLKFKTRGSQEPVIAHLVFNLTSKVDRKWGCYT